MLKTFVALLMICCGPVIASETLPELSWKLTSRPWTPLNTPREAYLEATEELCRWAAGHIDADGAFIDPYLKREHQYATPYFAYAAGALFREGRALDLLPVGLRAMDHATSSFAGGHRRIPDQHGEFFLAPLSEAITCYEGHAAPELIDAWRERLSKPLEEVIAGPEERTNNWRTYAMKGEWLRARHGLVARDQALSFIEDAWLRRTQRERVLGDALFMYQDWSSDPQSMAVEAVGRGNLLGLLMAGYDGPLREEILEPVKAATAATLFFQDPTGQAPPNGRTDNHVFNDALYLLCFEAMARYEAASKNPEAGAYRRAAHLAFQSMQRWRHREGELKGAFQVTKNFFAPEDRVGYQPASRFSNYNGALMYHLAEAYFTANQAIEERPAPAERGGYVLAADPAFGCAVANAGGMQLFVNLRGDSVPKYNRYWTPLGVTRFSRADWDSRLGPLDGVYDARERAGITFAPEWKVGRKWRRLSEEAKNYRGKLIADFVHPLFVRCHILYYSSTGSGGPAFRHDFLITPHCILTTLTTPNKAEFGLTLPVLADDGRPLIVEKETGLIRTAYTNEADEQVFFSCDAATRIDEGGETLRGGGGALAPYRVTTKSDAIRVVVYPRNPDQPSAKAFQASFSITEAGFESALGRVEGNYYQDAFAAGGEGRRIDLNQDGAAEARFSAPCRFLAHHTAGRLLKIESDRAVTLTYSGKHYSLQAHRPISMH